MNPIYSVSILVAVFALIFWFRMVARDKNATAFQWLLFGAIGAYLVALLSAQAPMAYKLQIALRDFIIIAVAGTAFSYIARLKALFWVCLLMTGGVLAWFYKSQLMQTFPYQQRSQIEADGELLLELADQHSLTEIENLLEMYHLTATPAFQADFPERTELDDYYLIDVPNRLRTKLPEIRNKLQQHALVDWVENNERIHVDPVEQQKLPAPIQKRFGINDPGLEHLWSFDRMQMDKLYAFLQKEKIKPVKKALVAILDTGVDAKHEDLSGNYRSLRKKYDNDPRNHGTHCAGIAGAVSNNGLGVASYAPDNGFVEITSVKVLGSLGYGSQQTIINGILEAADKGADVISLSLGGMSNDSRQRAYSQAVDYARKAGAIVVAAAGNSSMNAKDYSPVNAKGIIGVSAVDNELNKAAFSNTVQDIEMGIAAPGVGIYSTVPGNKYETYNGTSMATPYVSGLIGLLKSLKPDLTTEEAHQILKQTGIKTDETRLTGRFIQPYEAVAKVLAK